MPYNIDTMSFRLPGLVIGYHGCDETTADKVLFGEERLRDSVNDYDWLGRGQYFWEYNEQRAYAWARERCKRPCVIGAVIDMGNCLNLMDASSISLVRLAYDELKDLSSKADIELPVNRNAPDDKDKIIRRLDCAVISHLHKFARKKHSIVFDTIRGLFLEGEELYPEAGFRDKTHIQICVVNPACIKGYFMPTHFYS